MKHKVSHMGNLTDFQGSINSRKKKKGQGSFKWLESPFIQKQHQKNQIQSDRKINPLVIRKHSFFKKKTSFPLSSEGAL